MILMITCKPINPSLHNCGVCASEPPNMHADMKKVNKFATLVLVKQLSIINNVNSKMIVSTPDQK